jgi:adenylate cyclase class 2
LTFKKRIENASDVKEQTEHESEFADADAVAEILAELGFKPRIIYEKRRETWLFRTVEIVMDELPFGLFMEIEGSITSIKEAEMILGLEELETEQETYPRLAARLGIEKDGVLESRFPPK